MRLDKKHREAIQMVILKNETVKLSEVAKLVKKYGKPASVRELRDMEANRAAHSVTSTATERCWRPGVNVMIPSTPSSAIPLTSRRWTALSATSKAISRVASLRIRR